jgi:hypothetical protein
MAKFPPLLLAAALFACRPNDSSAQTAASSSTTAHSTSPTLTGEPTGQDHYCQKSERLVQLDQSSRIPPTRPDAGLVLCENGLLHRDMAVHCFYPLVADTCPCTEPCTELGDGVCHNSVLGCGCKYPCTEDSECPIGAACLCAASLDDEEISVIEGQCVPANCRSDMDCGGYPCAATRDGCGYVNGLYCQSGMDLCSFDSQCVDLGLGNHCAFSQSEMRWVCEEYSFCID